MPDAAQLHHDADSVRQKVQDHRAKADQLSTQATDYTKNGDTNKAISYSEQAIKEREAARALEEEATKYETRAADLEAKAFREQEEAYKQQKKAQENLG